MLRVIPVGARWRAYQAAGRRLRGGAVAFNHVPVSAKNGVCDASKKVNAPEVRKLVMPDIIVIARRVRGIWP